MSGEADESALKDEARALHRAIFGAEIPDELARRYVEAHAFCIKDASAADRDWMRRAVAARADLEALEIALRVRSPRHVLVRKARILVYLAESLPQYYDRFVNDRPRRAAGWCVLAGAALRTGYKLAKGRLLLLRPTLRPIHA
jgi:hypothetical protein